MHRNFIAAIMLLQIHFIGVAAMAIELSEKTPQVNTEQNTNETIKTKRDSKPLKNPTKGPALVNNLDGAPIACYCQTADKTDKGKDGGAEFCGPFFGFKIRLADIFMIAFTAAIAGFTWSLKKSTDNLWKSGEKQIQLAREEFISSHRPKIILRSITIEPPSHSALPIEEGKPIKIQGAVVNVGDTPTEIVDSNLTILVGGTMFHARTPFGSTSNNLNDIKLVPGGAYTFWITADHIDFTNSSQIASLNRHEKIIYFFGFIMYRDGIGNIRRTAFCRKYIPETECFDIVDNPDYEYTD